VSATHTAIGSGAKLTQSKPRRYSPGANFSNTSRERLAERPLCAGGRTQPDEASCGIELGAEAVAGSGPPHPGSALWLNATIAQSLTMRPRSTREVAEIVGISRSTLERWLAEGKVPMPKKILVGTRVSRIWTSRAIERVEQYKAKFYGKGRGASQSPSSRDEAGVLAVPADDKS